MHYRVTRKSNRRIARGDLLLINCGARLKMAPRTSPARLRSASRTPRCATASLACCAAISRSPVRCFPTAREARSSTPWRGNFLAAGVDFEHGAGHGVGSYLSVHEGPARISKLGATPLKRGMILSNEPGYYKTDAFGCRIENLRARGRGRGHWRREALNAFETLTLAPMIVASSI